MKTKSVSRRLAVQWEAKAKELEAELATAQAQVAVMAEVLAYIAKFKPSEAHRKQMGKISQEIFDAICDKARDALSAAPKVLWSGEAEVNMYHDLHLTVRGNRALEGRSHTKVKTIVLDKQGEGE